MSAGKESLYQLLTRDGNSYASWVYVKFFELALHEYDLSSALYLVSTKNVDPSHDQDKLVKLAVRLHDLVSLKAICADLRVDISQAIYEAMISQLKMIPNILSFSLNRPMDEIFITIYPDIPREHRPKIIEYFAQVLDFRTGVTVLKHAVKTGNSEMLADLLACQSIVMSSGQVDELKKLGTPAVLLVIEKYVRGLGLKTLKAEASNAYNEVSCILQGRNIEDAFLAGYIAGRET